MENPKKKIGNFFLELGKNILLALGMGPNFGPKIGWSRALNKDNESFYETFCTILLTSLSQVVMVQSLQPKGCELESMCVLFLNFYSICFSSFL